MVKVLNIITRLERGGAPMALLETMRRLPTNEFQMDLVAGKTDDPGLDLADEIAASDISLIYVPELRRNPHPIRDLITLWKLIRIIRKGQYDLVHTHTSKAGFLGRIAAWLCRTPAVVHSPHGTVLEGYFSPFITWMYAFLERVTAPMANKIICLTSREIDQYLAAHIGQHNQYTFIYNGIDIDAFSQPIEGNAELRQSLVIPQDATLCVTVGRLVPVKGQADLIEAFAIAHKEHPNLHLMLVGEGELRRELESLTAKHDLTEYVHFVGWREDVVNLLAISDIFVLPSHNEGLGLVIIEAMARSLPVIATEVGGVPEVVMHGETGILTPAHAPDQFAQALVKLAANNTQRQEMGKAGYARALDFFSITSTARQTGELYKELIGASA